MVIDYEALYSSKPENVARLARALGVDVTGKSHAQACALVMRWYKRNPAKRPRRARRGTTVA